MVGWLQPPRHDAADEQVTRDRLMIHICLITSVYSVIYIITSAAIGYRIGVVLMAVCLLVLLALLAFFRVTGRQRLTGNLFLANCLFIAIFANTLFTGGVQSPVTNWTVLIPVCSVILLGVSKDTLAWLAVTIASLLSLIIASTLGHGFPELYDPSYRIIFAVICDLGLITILFLAAATFHANRNALIGELKQTQESLQATNRQIQSALEIQCKATSEQRNFMALISHEFRTPLGIISAAASVLSVSPHATGDVQTETDKVFRAVKRMDRMIEMLTDDDWLEIAAAEFRHTSVNLQALAELVAADISDMSPSRMIRLSLPEPLTVNGDRDLLAVALSNLIGNASKYSPATEPIEVRMRRWNNQAVIHVIDHGSGISPADMPRIFEKYYRSSTVEHTPGTGLGLYLVKRIVERHDGAISVESTPGRGTTFTLSLPLSG
jgi:signal transduction histidine kinase